MILRTAAIESPMPGIALIPQTVDDELFVRAIQSAKNHGGAIAVVPVGLASITLRFDAPLAADTLECPCCQSTLGVCGCRR